MRQLMRIVNDYAEINKIDSDEVTAKDIEKDISRELGGLQLRAGQKYLKVLFEYYLSSHYNCYLSGRTQIQFRLLEHIVINIK